MVGSGRRVLYCAAQLSHHVQGSAGIIAHSTCGKRSATHCQPQLAHMIKSIEYHVSKVLWAGGETVVTRVCDVTKLLDATTARPGDNLGTRTRTRNRREPAPYFLGLISFQLVQCHLLYIIIIL